MNRLKIEDGTIWPDPSVDSFRDIAWRFRYQRDAVTDTDLLNAAEIMKAYSDLIEHPAFTLKTVQKKVSGIRKAIKSNDCVNRPVEAKGKDNG